MRFLSAAAAALLATTRLAAASPATEKEERRSKIIAPKFFIISMFAPEAEIWYTNMPSSGLGNLLAVNISTPGLSMLFPHIHCVPDYSVCQLTTGEAEINAASSVMAAILSDQFDFTKTYFMVAGIAGVNPKYGTLGSVALSRYTVQVGQEYEFDAREMPSNFTTGYFGYGTLLPGQYPTLSYGTEVFEVNEALRDIAFSYASQATLSDDPIAAEYRTRYAADEALYAAATKTPSVIKCDSATNDVYFSGVLLGDAFENTTTLWTNGTGKYCVSAQEDSATLEVMVRMAIQGLVDFSRIILMRTGSDFDREPPGESAYDNLVVAQQNGFGISVQNIYNAGIEIVKGVLNNWDSTFKNGVKPTNYIGDIFGSLGGEPDFGLGSITGGKRILPNGNSGDIGLTKRSLQRRSAMGRRGLVSR